MDNESRTQRDANAYAAGTNGQSANPGKCVTANPCTSDASRTREGSRSDGQEHAEERREEHNVFTTLTDQPAQVAAPLTPNLAPADGPSGPMRSAECECQQGDQRPAEQKQAEQNGEQKQFEHQTIERLVVDHHASVFRYAYRLTGTAPDAEDLTQHAFLTAQANLGQLRSPESALSWLLTIVRNAFLKSYRRQVPIPAGNLELDVHSIPDGEVDDEIDREKLQAALNELPEEFRLVLVMFYFEDRTYREIAEQLDLPPGTVMSRLSRAKNHLRRKLCAGEEMTASPSNTKTSHSNMGRS